MAYTHSVASTYARIELLISQVRSMLRRTTSIDLDTLELLVKGVENKWIREFSVYALDKSDLCHGELKFSIDWNEHAAQLSIARAKVTIDSKWIDNTAIEVDEAIRAFNRFVSAKSLRTEWRLSYEPAIYSNSTRLNSVREALGLCAAETMKWAGKRQGRVMSIDELPEGRVGLYFAG
jgi:hypothetical protein